MRPDPEIKAEAERALRQDARLESTDIALAVNHGIVLLTGVATSEEEKWRAASAVARVAGVAGLANDIEVRAAAPGEASDPELARQAVDEVRWALPYSHRFVRLAVRSRWLTLEGEVEWNYQKDRAEGAAFRVTRIAGVTNALRVERRIEPVELKRAVEEAFKQRLPAA